jgi:hypothetical protein
MASEPWSTCSSQIAIGPQTKAVPPTGSKARKTYLSNEREVNE